MTPDDNSDADRIDVPTANRREAIKSLAGLALVPAAFDLPEAAELDEKAKLARQMDRETVLEVKELLAATGIWWDIESLAANVDLAEYEVRMAVMAMLRGRCMEIGEGLVVDWHDYGKFYRMTGVEVESIATA